MVQFCCVVGCGNRSNRDKKHFFRLPNVPKNCDKFSFKADIIMNRRKQWLMNINREDLKDGDAAYSPGYIRVCTDHFVSGKPSTWSDVENIDWAPTVMMGYRDIRRRRNYGLGSKSLRNRGRIHSNTVLKRKLRMQELKIKQEILQMLSLESDSEQSEDRVTDCPLIHKITIDCIVKVKCDENQTVHETEELSSAARNEEEIIS